jgi:hypothetical protein
MGLNYHLRTCLQNLKALRRAPYIYLGSSILGGGGEVGWGGGALLPRIQSHQPLGLIRKKKKKKVAESPSSWH